MGLSSGIVTWFNKARGYGFIEEITDHVLRIVFVHHSNIICTRKRKNLEPGDKVTFDLYVGNLPDTYIAKNVCKVV